MWQDILFQLKTAVKKLATITKTSLRVENIKKKYVKAILEKRSHPAAKNIEL
jgi:GTP1/Obg family GTP-binding protein